jgi:hypothetical protein
VHGKWVQGWKRPKRTAKWIRKCPDENGVQQGRWQTCCYDSHGELVRMLLHMNNAGSNVNCIKVPEALISRCSVQWTSGVLFLQFY